DDMAGGEDLSHYRYSCGDVECAEERRADIFGGGALKFDATALGFRQIAFIDQLFLTFQILDVFLRKFSSRISEQCRAKEPVAFPAYYNDVEFGKDRAESRSCSQRESHQGGFPRIGLNPIYSAIDCVDYRASGPRCGLPEVVCVACALIIVPS